MPRPPRGIDQPGPVMVESSTHLLIAILPEDISASAFGSDRIVDTPFLRPKHSAVDYLCEKVPPTGYTSFDVLPAPFLSRRKWLSGKKYVQTECHLVRPCFAFLNCDWSNHARAFANSNSNSDALPVAAVANILKGSIERYDNCHSKPLYVPKPER
jgi:hypothetical protein